MNMWLLKNILRKELLFWHKTFHYPILTQEKINTWCIVINFLKSNFSKYKKPRKSAVKMNGTKFVTNSLLLTFSFQRFRAAKKLFSQLVSELHSITKRLFTKWVTLKAFWTFWMPSGEIQVNGTETNKRQKGFEKIQFYGNNQKNTRQTS